MASSFDPVREDLFTFGLWTVGNPGRDPFGDAVRPVQDPNHLVRKLAELGAYGVNLHDNDLVPFGASAAQRDQIVKDFKKTIKPPSYASTKRMMQGDKELSKGAIELDMTPKPKVEAPIPEPQQQQTMG